MVKYEVTVDPEDIPFVGNCSAVDPETDREAEEWVRRELASGNDLAWCWVRVTARVGDFEGDASCGGISCRDREELERVFLPDLRADALAALRREVESYTTGRRERETVAAIRKRTREARAALAQLPPDAESKPEEVIGCWDNGGETVDRYTVAFRFQDTPRDRYVPMLAMSRVPTHPQGVSLWTEGKPGSRLGRRVKWLELPTHIREHVIARLQEDPKCARTS